MAEATLSAKYQLVIPKEIREEAGLKSGEKIIILTKDGVISLVPKHILKNMRGFLKGLDTKNYRDEKDRF
ncbi:MAG: AbrB/MazE/SpoVT family DNA-binding domain-containing protein [bacterium]